MAAVAATPRVRRLKTVRIIPSPRSLAIGALVVRPEQMLHIGVQADAAYPSSMKNIGLLSFS
ncbi:MAG TPA: hypothetical protein VJT12_09400 [Methyloceanibacter sp.]|jgi:hypothetical protein|nr:hypothetical protein [Methyloceanibacter sp.]